MRKDDSQKQEPEEQPAKDEKADPVTSKPEPKEKQKQGSQPVIKTKPAPVSYFHPSVKKNGLTGITYVAAAGYALSQHPGTYNFEPASLATLATYGFFMETCRQVCMYGGKLINEIMPPWFDKLTKSPSLLFGYALTLGFIFSDYKIPDKVLNATTKEIKPAFTQAASWLKEEVNQDWHDKKLHNPFRHLF